MRAVRGAPGPVVVGYDGSRGGNLALRAAAREAAARGGSLAVIAVTRMLDTGGSLGELIRAEKAATRQATEGIMATWAGLQGRWPDLKPTVRVVAGVNELKGSDLARSASLLVLGRRGRGGRRALTLGSASLELTKVIDCPVLLAQDSPPGATSLPTGGVVVGVKRPALDPTLTIAAAEARRRHAPLVVVHAQPHRSTGSRHVHSSPLRTLDTGTTGGERNIEQEVWTWIADRLPGHGSVDGVTYRAHIVTGDPVQALLDRATIDGLVVIGAHDRSTLTSMARGSVGQAVVERARSEVLIAR